MIKKWAQCLITDTWYRDINTNKFVYKESVGKITNANISYNTDKSDTRKIRLIDCTLIP